MSKGEVAEWLKAALSKSVIPGFRYRGFKSHPHRHVRMDSTLRPNRHLPIWAWGLVILPFKIANVLLYSRTSSRFWDKASSGSGDVRLRPPAA